MNRSSLGKLVDDIVASYAADSRTHRIGHQFLPSRTRMVQTLDAVRQLLFPGFFGHKELTESNLRPSIDHLVASLREDLEEEINACLCTSRQCTLCRTPKKCDLQAQDLTQKFLERVPAIRELLALDAQAAYDGDPAAKSIEEIIYCYPGFYAISVYRVAHELLKLEVPLMPRILSEHAHSVTGCDIHPGARVGGSFFVDHATGVVIGETTEIGDGVKIYQGVTLGARSFPKDERGKVIKGHKRHPTLMNNVTVYPNATILGGQTVIGAGVTVGANAFITESVEPHALVRQETPRLEVLSKKRHAAH